MGTRGLIKFICKGRVMYSYNRCDSQPFFLGHDLVKEIISIIEKYGLEWFIKQISNIKYVSRDSLPSIKPNKNLCSLLTNSEHPLKNIIDAGYIINYGYNKKNIKDDIMIEAVYVIDLDKKYFYMRGYDKHPIESLPKNLYSYDWCDENFETVYHESG